ncbi:hypothetical protein AAG570_002859 [Ranatra chinensis]|uniref:Uncharacterized protein n=1 Tax=Ranatra chinensis TaxID=642074 RepID=A0ABD0YRV3_9HEMI
MDLVGSAGAGKMKFKACIAGRLSLNTDDSQANAKIEGRSQEKNTNGLERLLEIFTCPRREGKRPLEDELSKNVQSLYQGFDSQLSSDPGGLLTDSGPLKEDSKKRAIPLSEQLYGAYSPFSKSDTKHSPVLGITYGENGLDFVGPQIKRMGPYSFQTESGNLVQKLGSSLNKNGPAVMQEGPSPPVGYWGENFVNLVQDGKKLFEGVQNIRHPASQGAGHDVSPFSDSGFQKSAEVGRPAGPSYLPPPPPERAAPGAFDYGARWVPLRSLGSEGLPTDRGQNYQKALGEQRISPEETYDKIKGNEGRHYSGVVNPIEAESARIPEFPQAFRGDTEDAQDLSWPKQDGKSGSKGADPSPTGVSRNVSNTDIQLEVLKAGGEEHTSVQGLNEHTSVQGLNEHTSVQGLNEHTSIQGLNEHTSVQGLNENTSVQGPNEHTSVQGLNEHTSVQGLNEHPIIVVEKSENVVTLQAEPNGTPNPLQSFISNLVFDLMTLGEVKNDSAAVGTQN